MCERENFREINFRSLMRLRKFFNNENFPIYGITISTPVPKSHQNLGSKSGECYAETAKGDRSLSIEMT